MVAYQMVALADQNGRTYTSEYGEYSKETGFILNESTDRLTKPQLLDALFHDDCWSIKKDIKKMTKADIEKELGYEIEIDGYDNQEDYKKTYKLTDKQADELKDAMRDLFHFWW